MHSLYVQVSFGKNVRKAGQKVIYLYFVITNV